MKGHHTNKRPCGGRDRGRALSWGCSGVRTGIKKGEEGEKMAGKKDRGIKERGKNLKRKNRGGVG